jgi:cytochrome c biogenesis protein
MSAINGTENSNVTSAESTRSAHASTDSFVTRVLTLLSSVRFGVTLLILLVIGSMLGMLIMQQNVDGFDKYFSELTPSQQLVGGTLGLFDIYHTWYFNALLLILSLNIVLASIDRFPKAWTFVSRKKLDASRKWLTGQDFHWESRVIADDAQTIAERVAEAFKANRLKPVISQKKDQVFVFGERGTWNRLGAYAVHVGLLTIFTGGFLTTQFGREGQMRLQPGQTSSSLASAELVVDKSSDALSVRQSTIDLPFTVTCTDIQQTLIRPEGSIQANNTLDWLTRINIKDEFGQRSALVHLNEPYDYRGYRFFQASFIANGKARNIKLRLTPEKGGQPVVVTVPRDGSTTLADGTQIDFKQFFSEFSVGAKPEQMGSADYNNPVAQLVVRKPSGEEERAFAFPMDLPDNAPVGKAVAGYKFKLIDFEKVPDAHVLAVKKDPGKMPFYLGGVFLISSLIGVFFFSHQRVWALIEPAQGDYYNVILGGNTNRNRLGFEDRFKRLSEAVQLKLEEAKLS